MKKLILIPILVVTTFLNAQLSIGVKGGVNISNFTGGNFDTIKNNAFVAFHLGGLLHFKFGKLVLQPELLFSSQGAKLEHAGNEATYKVFYVNIPVVLQYETDGGFYLEAGPQIGFKVSEDIPDMTIENFAKETDFSVALGLGFHSRKGFGIGGRYTVGISKVGDFDSQNINPDFKNGVIQISLFYTFFNKNKKSK
jgi:Outer membrane protein beta-barrel domain